jgi:hypothetical protein
MLRSRSVGARATDPLHHNIDHRTSLFSYRRADWYAGNRFAVGIIAIVRVQSPGFFQEQPATFLNRRVISQYIR